MTPRLFPRFDVLVTDSQTHLWLDPLHNEPSGWLWKLSEQVRHLDCCHNLPSPGTTPSPLFDVIDQTFNTHCHTISAEKAAVGLLAHMGAFGALDRLLSRQPDFDKIQPGLKIGLFHTLTNEDLPHTERDQVFELAKRHGFLEDTLRQALTHGKPEHNPWHLVPRLLETFENNPSFLDSLLQHNPIFSFRRLPSWMGLRSQGIWQKEDLTRVEHHDMARTLESLCKTVCQHLNTQTPDETKLTAVFPLPRHILMAVMGGLSRDHFSRLAQNLLPSSPLCQIKSAHGFANFKRRLNTLKPEERTLTMMEVWKSEMRVLRSDTCLLNAHPLMLRLFGVSETVASPNGIFHKG